MAKFENIDPKLIQELSEGFKRTAEFFKILPKYIIELANYGWFITLDLTPRDTSEICQKIDEKNTQWLDYYLAEYTNGKINIIEVNVKDYLPNRMRPILSGIKAHKEKNYYLSIPVLLAQIDGICFDHFKAYFFSSKDESKKKIKDQILNLNFDSILSLYLGPLQEKINISSGKNNYIHPQIYNRHEIMHGINNEYGSETNSLKVISLLDYMMNMTGIFTY